MQKLSHINNHSGGILWESELALAWQILYEPRVYSLISECSKPLVVELGAGTALCGNLLCKEFNAEAIVTDTTDVLASLNANISANWNHDLSRDHQEGKSMPVAMQCDWTNVSDVDAVINAIHARSECDQIFLIACDVLFSEHLVRALTSMIARVLHASSSQIRRRASSALVCSDRRCERAARAYDDASKQMFATQMPLPTWMADLSEHMVFDLLRLE